MTRILGLAVLWSLTLPRLLVSGKRFPRTLQVEQVQMFLKVRGTDPDRSRTDPRQQAQNLGSPEGQADHYSAASLKWLGDPLKLLHVRGNSPFRSVLSVVLTQQREIAAPAIALQIKNLRLAPVIMKRKVVHLTYQVAALRSYLRKEKRRAVERRRE